MIKTRPAKLTNHLLATAPKITLFLIAFAFSIIFFDGLNGSAYADIAYSIIYDDNVVIDMPVDVNSKTLNSTVQISTSKPKRNGLSFYGWCNTIPTNVDGNDTCSGTTFAIGSDWSINPTTVNNNLKLYAMWGEERPEPQPSTAGCINYFANASDAVGTMGCQSATDGASLDLLASNFSRTGYGFAGWSDSFDYATNPNAKFYGPQETITVPTGTTANGLSLYAVWIESQGSIQDQSKVASVCNSLTTAPTDGTANLTSVSALTDQRDNNTYAIAKLADGNCWMIENLRLDNTAEHNSDGTLAQGYGTSATYGNFGGLADAESSNFTNSTTANSLYYSGTQEGTASIDIGTSDSPGYRMPRYNNLNTSTRASSPTNNRGNMYSYGNYYTWHAAIADLTYNGTNNQSTTGTSLCPAGWHLPKGGNKSNEANNELWSLVVDGINGGTKPASYDSSTYPNYTGTPEGRDASNKLRAYPNNLLYSGIFSTSSANLRGDYGYYWSSTAGNIYYSYHLSLDSSGVFPGTYNSHKRNGSSIRCTAGS